MDEELVEKVARSIAQADEQNGGPPYDFRIQNKHSKEQLFDESRAAIQAMMDAGWVPSAVALREASLAFQNGFDVGRTG